MEGKYSFTSPEWADISGDSMIENSKQERQLLYLILSIVEEPKDLIRKCLVVDPSKRINVQDVLKHQFFNQMVSTTISHATATKSFLMTLYDSLEEEVILNEI